MGVHTSLIGVLFAPVHLRAFHPTVATHSTCVFPSLTDAMRIVGPVSNLLPFFMITGVWNISTFSVVNEVCNLVSTQGLD